MGKQLGPIKCKVCGGEHQGTLCTKFNSVKVLSNVAQSSRLALPKPVVNLLNSANNGPGDGGDGVALYSIAHKPGEILKIARGLGLMPPKPKRPRKAKKAKQKISAHRKAYLAEKAKERRAADKMGMDLPAYRAFLEKSK